MSPRWRAAALAALCAASTSALQQPSGRSTAPLSAVTKTLMGPGPTSAHPRVLAAAALPSLGHMHPEVSEVMLDIQDWLRYAFQTSNNYTIALSASGHGGMEASMLNFVEPGDVVLVGTNGIWGERAADIARRAGGVVRELSAAPGTVYTLAALEAAFAANPGAKLLFLTHGESSTGTLQPVGGIGALAHAHGALFVLDTVCTLAGVPVAVDEDEIDVVYSGSQKALGAPPGVAPLTLSPRALARFALRAAPPASYYFDAGLLGRSWAVGGAAPRWYHATHAVPSLFALREALAMLVTEGLPQAWGRHAAAARQLAVGLEALGLSLYVAEPGHRLPTVTTIVVPDGVAWADVTARMMKVHGVEMSGGLGPTAGQVWRVGLMGHNARPATVALLLHALEEALVHVGWRKPAGPQAAAAGEAAAHAEL